MSNDDDTECDQEIDFSVLSYEEWIELIFNRPISQNTWAGIEFAFEPKSYVVLIEHLTRMCLEFSTLRPRFSWEQINQGVWSVLTHPVETIMLLYREPIPQEIRLLCIRAMFEVFSGTVSKMEEDIPMETCFFMWWDIVGFEFCGQKNGCKKEVFVPKEKSDQELQDVIFETLVRVLELNDTRCQNAALHGLGHLHHPRCAEVVQKYIDAHKADGYSAEDLQWLYDCRDGVVM